MSRIVPCQIKTETKEESMNNLERLEHRYFCNSSSSDSVEKTLDSLGTLTKISYPLPVTETIYFTYGVKAKYQAPTGLTVRLRRYTSELSEVMEVTSDAILLEIKRHDRASGVNIKEQISMPGIDAVRLLVGIDDRLALRQLLDTIADSQLFPTGAMQSYRCHWIHPSGMRVTLDKDIRFFLFAAGNLYVARRVSNLGEGKLEFKFPKVSANDRVLEQEIVAACRCTRPIPGYLGRRARECLLTYMSKQNKH